MALPMLSGPGRSLSTKTIVDLILRMVLENRSWGYTRIRGALADLGHQVRSVPNADALQRKRPPAATKSSLLQQEAAD